MKTLQDLTVLELKAVAYDAISTLEKTQNNLKLINQELGRRQAPQPLAEKQPEVTGTESPDVIPVDPAEEMLCEGCQ